MPQLVHNFRMLPRLLQFLPVFRNGLIVSSQAGVRKPEVIVSEANGRVKAERGLELVDGRNAAVRVQVGTPQEHVREGIRRRELDDGLEFIGSRGVVLLTQAHKREIKTRTRFLFVQISSSFQLLASRL